MPPNPDFGTGKLRHRIHLKRLALPELRTLEVELSRDVTL
jgi:hypothetical protein